MERGLCRLPASCCQQPWTLLSLFLPAPESPGLSLPLLTLFARPLSSLLLQRCPHATPTPPHRQKKTCGFALT